MPSISAASSVETNAHINLDPITDIPLAVLVTTSVPPNQLTLTHNLPALMSHRLIPHYAARLTPPLKALLAADPPLQLERNISVKLCMPPIIFTDDDSMVSTTNRSTPWSSQSYSRTKQSKKSPSTKAARLTSYTRQHTRNSIFLPMP